MRQVIVALSAMLVGGVPGLAQNATLGRTTRAAIDSVVTRFMVTNHVPGLSAAAGVPTGYALGWGTDTANGFVRVGHVGGQQGTSTVIVLVPTLKAGVVVFTNIDRVDVLSLANAILAIVIK